MSQREGAPKFAQEAEEAEDREKTRAFFDGSESAPVVREVTSSSVMGQDENPIVAPSETSESQFIPTKLAVGVEVGEGDDKTTVAVGIEVDEGEAEGSNRRPAQAAIPGAFHVDGIREGEDTTGEAEDMESGLVEADLVTVPNQIAQPVPAERGIQSKKQWIAVGLCLLVGAVGFGVSVFFIDNDASTPRPASSVSSPPNRTEDEETRNFTWDLPFQVSTTTIQTLRNDWNETTPVSRAYQWVKEDPHLNSYASERLLQRFVLAVFFYATKGDTSWKHQGGGTVFVTENLPPKPGSEAPPPANGTAATLEQRPARQTNFTIVSQKWLSYEHSECEWFSTGVVVPGRFQACNDDNDVLTHLILEKNDLQGSLPLELSLLSSLRTLSTRGNKIGGTVCTEIGELKSVGSIHIPHNQHTGHLPSEIGLLSDTLTELTVMGNQLSGTLPSELWSLSNVRRFKMDSNRFHGSLPETIGGLSSLEQITLNFNRFTGTIPSSLGELPRLFYVSMVKNKFVGIIPTEMGALRELTKLDVSDNKLAGSIPSQIGSLPLLKTLWLEGNIGLNGQFPSALGKLNDTLTSLKIRDTSITGTIPLELCGISQLEFDCSTSLCGCGCPCS